MYRDIRCNLRSRYTNSYCRQFMVKFSYKIHYCFLKSPTFMDHFHRTQLLFYINSCLFIHKYHQGLWLNLQFKFIIFQVSIYITAYNGSNFLLLHQYRICEYGFLCRKMKRCASFTSSSIPYMLFLRQPLFDVIITENINSLADMFLHYYNR